MGNQRDHCKQQKNVYQSAGHVENKKPAQPRKQQNCKQNDEHISLLILLSYAVVLAFVSFSACSYTKREPIGRLLQYLFGHTRRVPFIFAVASCLTHSNAQAVSRTSVNGTRLVRMGNSDSSKK